MARPVRKPAKGWWPRFVRVMWTVAAFFLVGYVSVLVLYPAVPDQRTLGPSVGMGLAGALMVPFGLRAKSIRRGALRGVLLGTVAGLAMTGAMTLMVRQGLVAERMYEMMQQATTAPAEGAAPTAAVAAPPAPAPPDPSRSTPGSGATPATGPATSQPALPYVDVEVPLGLRWQIAGLCLGGAVTICTAAGAFGAAVARRRRRRIDAEWDSPFRQE